MKLRKIPLEPLLEILQDLYDSGADFIDISGDQNEEGEEKKDVIKITIKPEYLMVRDEDDDEDDDEDEDPKPEKIIKRKPKDLSEEDLMDLI